MENAKCIGGIGQLLPKFVLWPIMQHYADRLAVVDGDKKFTYREMLERSFRLGNGLLDLGVKKGDHITVIMPNVHENIEAHYAIMGLGCTIVPLNTRLASEEILYMVNHSESSGIIIDWEYTHLVSPILDQIENCRFIIITSGGGKSSELQGLDYEELLTKSSPDLVDLTIAEDEDMLCCIQYSSGTTDRPKGVMVSYRAAWMRMLQLLEWVRPTINDVYLHIVPFFHGQAWGAFWTIPRVGGVNVCLRYMDPGFILKMIRENGVTCWCGAPTISKRTAFTP